MAAQESPRKRHVVELYRLPSTVGGQGAPKGLVACVRELDELVAEADARVAALERDVRSLEGDADADGLRSALAEFDGVWGALGPEEQARVLALVLDQVVVDSAAGDAEIRFRGWR